MFKPYCLTLNIILFDVEYKKVLHWHKAYISYFPGRSGRLESLIHFRRSMLFPY